MLVVWLSTAAIGFAVMLQHDFDFETVTATSKTDAMFQQWRESEGWDNQQQAILVLAVHPQCPCTANTIRELETCLTQATISVRCVVLQFAPEKHDMREQWSQTHTMQQIKRIPNVQVIEDPMGSLASSMGLDVSGTLLAADTSGTVVFRGGITGSRSCVSDNAGSSSLASFLSGVTPRLATSPVYGCRLGSR